MSPDDYNRLYAEKCRLGLDLAYREQQLDALRRQARIDHAAAARERQHLQRRIDALIRVVRRLHAEREVGERAEGTP
ncbi:hypothetical protein [Streptomyces sp. NPDC059928]|uniref:hypothetical protein n=1 Tax=unclassified Streptomyces TaxID=2593676 RepID=UPI003654402A